MKLLKKNEGITLVALVVTIIVLIILAGVSISLVLGQDGVVQKAKAGRDNYAEAARLENEQLANLDTFAFDVGDINPPTGTINMTNGDLTISATINLGDNTDLQKTKYVFTTSSEPLGLEDESLYSEGTIESTSTTITKAKTAGTYYLHILTVSRNGYKDEIISETGATCGGKKDFNYTGNEQTITLVPGNYRLEVWGAQGGYGYSNNSSYQPGNGGYAKGDLQITSNVNAYIYAGGSGATGVASTISQGGFNGGGASGYNYSGSGGGASDIRLEENDLYSRVIVAGGGGRRFILFRILWRLRWRNFRKRQYWLFIILCKRWNNISGWRSRWIFCYRNSRNFWKWWKCIQ